MNERIKELAQEVFSFKYKTAPNELNPGHHMDHLHKFAELIVEECIAQANGVIELRGVNDDMIYGADIAASKIAKHFGILTRSEWYNV